MTHDSRTRSAAEAALPPWIRTEPGGVAIEIHLQPGARRNAIVGLHGGRLKIALQAPPIDGRANAALLAFIAERCDVAVSAVGLAAGASQRLKRVMISCAATRRNEVVARLAPPE